jgi:hypothetical protein
MIPGRQAIFSTEPRNGFASVARYSLFAGSRHRSRNSAIRLDVIGKHKPVPMT